MLFTAITIESHRVLQWQAGNNLPLIIETYHSVDNEAGEPINRITALDTYFRAQRIFTHPDDCIIEVADSIRTDRLYVKVELNG